MINIGILIMRELNVSLFFVGMLFIGKVIKLLKNGKIVRNNYIEEKI